MFCLDNPSSLFGEFNKDLGSKLRIQFVECLQGSLGPDDQK